MNRHLIFGLGLYCFTLNGCADNTPPTLDLPSGADLGVASQSTDAANNGIDAETHDLSLPPDQAFIPSSNPIPTRVETSVNVEEIRAGQQAQVVCTVFDNQGMTMDEASTQIDLRPAAGIQFESTEMGWIVTGEIAGSYEIFCTYPSAGLRDESGTILKILPGEPAWVQTRVSPEVVVAGDDTQIECDVADAYGNAVPDSEDITVNVSPASDLQTLTGRFFSTTQAGEVTLTCTAGTAETTPAVLVVRPDVPTQLSASLVPSKMVYKIGEVVSVAYFVGDQYGNAYPNYAVDFNTQPMLESFGPRRFRLNQEGLYTVTVNVPDSEPMLSTQLEVKVDDRGPIVDCNSPAFGETLVLSDGVSLPLTGSVSDLSGVTQLFVDGSPIGYDGGSSFSTTVQTTPGLNIVEVEAIDGLGQSSRSLCGFFVAPDFIEPESISPSAIALDLRQGAVDDGDNGAEIKSFGDLIRIATRSDALTDTIDGVLSANPRLLRNQSFTVGRLEYIDYRGGLSLSQPNSALALQEEGLGIGLAVANLGMNVRVKGSALFVSCTINGRINVRNTNASSVFRPNMDGGTLSFTALGTDVSVADIDTDFGGFCGNLVDLALGVAGAFSSFLEDTVADALRELINGTLAGLIGDALGGLDFSAFAFNFELEGFDGEVSNLDLTTSLTDVSVNTTRLQLGLGTRVSGPVRIPDAGQGVPLFGLGVLNDYPALGNMSALLDGVLLNQVMYGLWRAGFFTIDDVGAIGDGDGALNASISLLAPPAVEIIDDGSGFRLHFGPASGTLSYADLLTEPVALRFGAILTAGIELQPNGEVVFAPDGLNFETLRLDVADSGLSADLAAALEAEIGVIVAGLLDDAVSSAFPTLPIPEFGLPASIAEFGLDPNVSLGIRNPSLDLKPQSIIINGGFGQ